MVDLAILPGGPKIGSIPFYGPHGWAYPTSDPGTNYIPVWTAGGSLLWTPSPTFTNLGVTGWEIVGGSGTPTNQSAGDVTMSRLIIPDQSNLNGLVNVYTNAAGVIPLSVKMDATASLAGVRVWLAGTGLNPRIQILASRGTIASPTAVQSGDVIGSYEAAGFYDTSNIGTPERIRWTATENWTSTAQGANARITATPAGSNVPQELLNLDGTALQYTNYSARATNASGTQTITQNTPAVVTFATEAYDTGTLHSTSSATSRLTALVAGRYHVSGGIYWTAEALSTTTILICNLLKNGTAIDGARQWTAPSAAIGTLGWGQNVAIDVNLAAGDYVEIQAYYDANVATTRTLTLVNCALSMHYIGGF